MRAIIFINKKCILSSTSYTVFWSFSVRIFSPITIAFFPTPFDIFPIDEDTTLSLCTSHIYYN